MIIKPVLCQERGHFILANDEDVIYGEGNQQGHKNVLDCGDVREMGDEEVGAEGDRAQEDEGQPGEGDDRDCVGSL